MRCLEDPAALTKMLVVAAILAVEPFDHLELDDSVATVERRPQAGAAKGCGLADVG